MRPWLTWGRWSVKWISGILSIIMLALAGPAWCDCSVTVTQAIFGNYDAIGYASLDTVADISVSCSSGAPYTIKSDPGQHVGAGFQRRMLSSDGGTTLNYNLFRDPACTEVWGDGTASTSVFFGTGTGGPLQHRVYGRIPGSQRVKADNYGDSVVVTVEW